MGASKSKHRIILSKDLQEQLRCSFCKQHLSCSPIRLLPDGSSVCGRCALSNPTGPIYRELALEAILSRITFPCRYKPYGCPEMLLFGNTIEHEAKCVYHPFPCMASTNTPCPWHGSMIQVLDHFQKDHASLVTTQAEFNFDVNNDKEGVLMVLKDGNTFLITYRYDSGTTGLKYDVRYFSSVAATSAYKICLVNSSKPQININLEGNRCLGYTTNSLQFKDVPVLTISKFLEVLGNPTNLNVVFYLPLIKETFKFPKSEEFINYDLLETLRCPECENHLALPIFDGPKGTVCADCAQNSPPSRNEELNRIIITTSYPCRWNHCKFIGKGHSIRLHEGVCPYQPQKCPAKHCKESLVASQRNKLEFHLLLHGYQYFCKRNVYTSAFQFNDERNIVTTGKNNEIIVIKHVIVPVDGFAKHIFTLASCKAILTNVVAAVYFEHSHCKLKSRRFVLDCGKQLRVVADMLPTCFRERKKMVVVVEV